MTKPTFLLSLFLAAASAAAQQPAPSPAPSPSASPGADLTFPAQIEQVNVDVVVTDKKGVPLTDLRREEFVVLEDGRPQQVVTFDAVAVPAVRQ